jgi:hypothetical protein
VPGQILADSGGGIRDQGAEGSDGSIGNYHIEVKTVSPGKKKKSIEIKRAGNFNQLLVVKVGRDGSLEGVKAKDLTPCY